MKISFDSTELIEELKYDISVCGRNKIFAVWLRKYPQFGNKEFIVNYDFITENDPIGKEEIGENERIVFMEAGILLDKLEEQNRLI